MQIFNKYVSHVYMNEHIYENLYGEKPYMSKTVPRRGVFANDSELSIYPPI